MNEIMIRKKPELEFVIEEHQEQFIQDVLKIYNLMSVHREEDDLPGIVDDILGEMRLSFLLAGILVKNSGEENFFTEEIKNGEVDPDFLEYWCEAHLDQMSKMSPGILMDGQIGMYEDVKTVLDHYYMSHSFGITTALANGWVVRHAPVVSVW